MNNKMNKLSSQLLSISNLFGLMFWTSAVTAMPVEQLELINDNGSVEEVLDIVEVPQWERMRLNDLIMNQSGTIELPDGTVLTWNQGDNLYDILDEANVLDDWQESFQSQLKNINSPNVGWARIDFVYGSTETQRFNTISGSYNQGFQVDCQFNCAYIELDDLENIGSGVRGSLEGKQWISGLTQNVEGGRGCLKWINGGKEPTGRHPFGGKFKVVVTEIDETTDTVQTSLYFNLCNWCGCTPYYIGPFQFLSYHTGDWIFIGFD